MWYCGRKGTGIYSYRVISAPGMLLVYGDVGNYMLQANDCNLIPWLRGAIKSEDYIISKMVRKREVFLPDEAVPLLDIMVEEAKENDKFNFRRVDEDDNSSQAINLKKAVLNVWSPKYGSYEEFAKAFTDAGGECSLLQRVIDFESSVYLAIECLSKFVELLDGIEDIDEPSICSSLLGLTERLNVSDKRNI